MSTTKKGAPPPTHDGPVLALAFAGGALVSAGADGRVLRFEGGDSLEEPRVLRDAPDDPAAALAPVGDLVACATATTLFVWGASGAEVARAKLAAPAVAMVARGDRLFVLGGGAIAIFELTNGALRAKGSVEHGAGDGIELDVDDAAERAVVVRDRKVVELIALDTGKSLAEWTRKGRTAKPVSVRFLGKGDTLVSPEGGYRLVRLKGTTGRVTGTVAWLCSGSNGAVVLDAARSTAAVRGAGQDVEVVSLGDPSRTLFLLEPQVTPEGDKVLASLGRLPLLAEIAPGMFVRKGSTAAPAPPEAQTAHAIDGGGQHVAAGFVSGEIVLADTRTGSVVSTHRGALAEPRCVAMLPARRGELECIAQDGAEVWLLAKERVCVADLAVRTLREMPLESGIPTFEPLHPKQLALDGDAVVYVDRREAIRWSRRDGALLARRALPENKGAFFHDGAVVVLPLESLSQDGFDLVAMDLATGDMRVRTRFVRDAERFPLGDDPKGWAAVGCAGTQPFVNVWAGKGLTSAQTFALDADTGALGASLPWNGGHRRAHGRYSAHATPPDGIVVRALATGDVVTTVAFPPGEGLVANAAYDPVSRTTAGVLSYSRVGVFDEGGALRLTLHGHREVTDLCLAPGGSSLLAYDFSFLRIWNLAP